VHSARTSGDSPTMACITVGGSVEEAAWWFITLARCCRCNWVAQAARTPLTLSPEAGDRLGAPSSFGNPDVARFSSRSRRHGDVRRADVLG